MEAIKVNRNKEGGKSMEQMTKEFNLSDKIFKRRYGYCENKILHSEEILVKDVKEAIKELKEKFNPQFEDSWAEEEINKIFGDKLI